MGRIEEEWRKKESVGGTGMYGQERDDGLNDERERVRMV